MFVELVLIVAILGLLFGRELTDLKVPFNYWGDTLWFTTLVKGMVDNGWVYIVPQLSAPHELHAIAFPAATHFDWMVMKLISLFTSSPGKIVNVFWLATMVFSAWTATAGLRLLGIRYALAVPAAVAYGLLPFAFDRNVAHINLTYYVVPILSVLAIHLALGARLRAGKTIERLGYVAAVIQGLNYIYFSFFAVVFLVVGGAVGSFRCRSAGPARLAAIFVSVIIISSAINLAPTFVNWAEHGQPIIGYKVAAEAEVYGLKIRQMLVPHKDNVIPWLSEWAVRDESAAFQNENENQTARLGPLAALGFLFAFLVAVGFRKSDGSTEWELIGAASSFLIVAVFVGTVGGLGAIFNVLIAPDIRCYNRISVFIAFFALVCLTVFLEHLARSGSMRHGRYLIVPIFFVAAVLSVHDQILSAGYLVGRRAADVVASRTEGGLVRQMEALFPSGAKIFQLPVTEFPVDQRKGQMLQYDHSRPYLHSKTLKWSWPAFSPIDKALAQRITSQPGRGLPESLVLLDFGAVWLDRHGYTDNGSGIEKQLQDAGAVEVLTSDDRRYVVFHLSAVVDRLRLELGATAYTQKAAQLRNAPFIEWGEGFYDEEHAGTGATFRWSQAQSELRLHNSRPAMAHVLLTLVAASSRQGSVTLKAGDLERNFALTEGIATIELDIKIPARSAVSVALIGDMGRIELPAGETRDLHFMLSNAEMTPFGGVSEATY